MVQYTIMRRILLTCLFILIHMSVFSTTRVVKKAELLYQEFSFPKAIQYYEKADSLTSLEIKHLAECYDRVCNYEQAEKVYFSIINNPVFTNDDLFRLIVILKRNGKYKEAEEYMGIYYNNLSKDIRSGSFKETQSYFDQLLQENNLFQIRNLKMNSSEIDFSPAFYGSDIVFASSRRKWSGIKRLYNWNQKAFLDIFHAKVDSIGEFEKPSKLRGKINRKWNDGPACFARAGSLIAYTQDDYSNKDKNAEIKLNIFFSEKKGKKWGKPIAFTYNNKYYSVGHPSLTEDGNTLYFSSDMPGGFGGVDIYVVNRKNDGEWGPPENLGSLINTEGNEVFPNFQEQINTLFYSSDGLYGLGGLDIYTSIKTKNGFSKAHNLGAPLNSLADDFGLIFNPSKKLGYFSSNRVEGMGDDDIYMFKFDGILRNSVAKHELYVLDKITSRPITEAKVLFENSQDKKSGDLMNMFELGSTYKLQVTAQNYETNNSSIAIGMDEFKVYRDTVLLSYVKNDTQQSIDNEQNLNDQNNTDIRQAGQPLKLKNIYFDFNKWDILPESANELDKLCTIMKSNSSYVVEISAHTDYRGSVEYNLALSKKRSTSVYNYLVQKGLDSTRMVLTYYGEHKPIYAGVKLLSTQIRENRRAEFIIKGVLVSTTEKQIWGDYFGNKKK